MSSQPVEANVVLTSDNTQYDQAMQQSSMSTDKLGKSVDSLGAKINALSKSAGRKILGITAADVALIGGATAAWSSYEKQMSRLQAQAAITTRSREQETRAMKDYTSSVKDLRSQFGATTTDAAALTMQITKLSDGTRGIKDLADTFELMSKATGESSDGLASSLLNLQKIMGTPQTQTKQYADQLTYLAAKSNTSATALADFSAQLAPMGRAMGMSQTQVTGFASMFSKAGQDGLGAATAFTKVSQDILQAVQTGSPDLHKYANLLGVTVSQFKEMGGERQLAGFLDAIARLGPKASMELNRFGLDGVRMSKQIIGTVQSSGGAMNAIREAQYGYGSDAIDKGAEAAHTMSDTMAKLRQDVQQTAESFGQAFGPGIDLVLRQVERLASGFQNLMDGPLGKFLQFMAAVVVPIGAAAGALLLLAGTITKLGAAFAIIKSSGGYGLLEGMRGGARITPELTEAGLRTGRYVAAGGAAGEPTFLGKRGAQIAEGGTWFQRMQYNSLQGIGAGARRGWGFLGGVGTGPTEEGGEGRPNIWRRGAVGGIRLGSDLMVSQLDALRFPNPADRSQWFGQHFPGRGPEVEQAQALHSEALKNLGNAQAVQFSTQQSQGATPDMKEEADKVVKAMEEEVVAREAELKSIMAVTAEQEAQAVKVAASTTGLTAAFSSARAEALAAGAGITKAFGEATLAAGRFAVGAAVKGAGSMLSAIGPMNLALIGASLLPVIIPMVQKLFGGGDKKPYEFQAYSGSNAYLAAANAAPGAAPALTPAEGAKLTPASARAITTRSVAAANMPGYKPTDTMLAGLNPQEATAYLSSDYAAVKRNPQALNSLKLDLINQFDQTTAERIMSDLDRGDTAGGIGTLYAGGQINQAMAYGQVSANQAYGQRGVRGQRQATAQAISGALGAAFKPGADVGTITEGLNKTYGLNLSTSDMQRLALEATDPGRAVSAEGKGGFWSTKGTAIGGIMNLIPGAPHTETETARMARIQSTSAALTGGDPAARMRAILQAGGPEATATMLGRLGLDPTLSGDAAINAITRAMGDTGGRPAATSDALLAGRVRRQGPAGRMFEGSDAIQTALGSSAQNVGQNVKAINEMLTNMRSAGMSAPEITKAMGRIQSTFGDPTNPNYILAGMVSGQAQQDLALKMPTMTRAQGFQSQVSLFQAQESIKPVTDEQYQAQQDAKNNMAQALTDQENYFKQMLLMQHQYEIQRGRAQADYHQQRTWQEQAYQLQRSRAEASFNRQRAYAVADYDRSVKRANFEFNLQRERTEADFNHQVTLQAKQMATSVYDVYQRVQAQRTSSASWLIANASDQLKRMQEQENNLQKLRAEGLSNQAIQTLKLTDPANAQEAARLVAEMTPQLVARFNKVAGTERVKAAKELVTDPSNPQWEEDRRNLRLQEKRSQDDHERSMKINHDDFFRGLDRQRKEFNIQMAQSDHDQQTAMDHMQTTYDTSMARAAQDVADAGLEISGNLTDILDQSISTLTGHAQQQAKQVKRSLTNLRNDTNPIAVAHMQELASIYGFEYKIPKGLGHYLSLQEHPQDNNPGPGPKHPGVQIGYHEGGLVPGYAPGRDDHMVPLSGGEAIMRPEWARAMGGAAIDAMNHAAKHGGFAAGGIYKPINASTSGHVHDQNTGFAAVDFSTSVGHPVYAVADGKIVQSYDIKGYEPRRVGPQDGYRSYGRVMYLQTDMGPEVLYAHLSKRGFGAGTSVHGGDPIGLSGNTGNTTGPHLHFGDSDGNPMEFVTGVGRGHGTIAGYAPGVLQSSAQQDRIRARLAKLHKDFYPGPEKAAWNMQGVHPLAPGDISTVINRMDADVIRRVRNQAGDTAPGGSIGKHPSGNLSNEQIVHLAAKRLGWGNEWSALRQIVMHESGFNNTAQNPKSTAYGMFQFLDSTWGNYGGHKTSDPWLQAKYGLNYIRDRYNDPNGAWDFWQAHNWYGDGAVFNGRQTIGVGERGPEAVIPLNDRGGEFLTKAMLGADARGIGLHSSPARGGFSVYNTRIDRSTNFTGPITVQANDPGELLNKLQARQRVMALSRPSLTGSAA